MGRCISVAGEIVKLIHCYYPCSCFDWPNISFSLLSHNERSPSILAKGPSILADSAFRGLAGERRSLAYTSDGWLSPGQRMGQKLTPLAKSSRFSSGLGRPGDVWVRSLSSLIELEAKCSSDACAVSRIGFGAVGDVAQLDFKSGIHPWRGRCFRTEPAAAGGLRPLYQGTLWPLIRTQCSDGQAP